MEIQLLFIVVGEFRAEELIYKVLIVLCHFFGDCLRIILASTDIAHGETVQKTCDKTAAPESRIIYHAIKDIWLTGKADTHVRLFEIYVSPFHDFSRRSRLGILLLYLPLKLPSIPASSEIISKVPFSSS